MSKNRVNVTVNLVDKFSKTLKKLEGQLDKIDKKTVRPQFEFGDNGQIERMKKELASIDNVVNTKLNILGKPALKETQASVKSLSGIENVYIKTHDHELNKTIAKMEALKRRRRIQNQFSAQDEFLQNIHRSTQRAKRHEGRATRRPISEIVRKDRFKLSDLFYADRKFRNDGPVGGVTGMDFNDLGNRFGGDGRDRRRHGLLGRVGQRLRSSLPGGGGGGGGPGSGDAPWWRRGSNWVMYNLIPRGQLTQDLAAVFMPFMFTAYTAAMGALAAAMAPAIAGVTALSLGILGFGENAADSLHLAKVRLRLFGRELHKVFKPTSKTFAPFVDQWFKTLPHTLARELNQPLQGMVVWMPTVERIGAGLLGWTRDMLNNMNRLQPVISRIVMQLGADTGDALIRFFIWLIEELDNSYDAIKTTLGAFKELAIFVYRVSLLWTQAIANLGPLIAGLGKLVNTIVNNRVLGTIVSWSVSLAIVGAVVAKIYGLFLTLAAFLTGTFIASVAASLAKVIGLTAVWLATLSAAAKMAVIATAGIAAIAGGIAIAAIWDDLKTPDDPSGGFSGTGGPRGPPTGSTSAGGSTINIYGNPDNTQIEKFKDMFPGEYRQESNINDRMTPS